jgi:hypothetical protein
MSPALDQGCRFTVWTVKVGLASGTVAAQLL